MFNTCRVSSHASRSIIKNINDEALRVRVFMGVDRIVGMADFGVF
jgi:hypothetical protein